MAKPIVISILANANQANATITKTSRTLGAVGKAGRLAAGGLAIVGVAAAAAAVSSTKSLIRIERINAQTASAIKATGGAARVSAKHIENLTGKLEATTSTEAETIQEGANLLLTFKKVGNQVGKNNKIFDRGVKASVDLSRSGFGTVQSASVLMGKALNDPIKGVSALGRSGVTFSQKQKDTIKRLVETNQTLKAQKIILKEVEGQVGGAGEAFRKTTAGKIEQFQHQLGTLGETIMTGAMPYLTKLMDYLLDTVVPGVQALAPKITAAVSTVKSFFTSMSQGSGEAGAAFTKIRTYVTEQLASIQSIISSTVSIVTSLWAKFGSDLVTYARNSLTNVLTVIRGITNVISGIFKTVAAILKGDWKGAWEGIKQIAKGALQVVGGVVRQGMNVAVTAVRVAKTAISSAATGAFNGIKDGAQAGWAKAKAYVSGIPAKITSALGNLSSLLTDAGRQVMSGLIGGISGKIGELKSKIGSIGSSIKGAFKSAMDINSPSRVMRTLGRYVTQGIQLGMLDGQGEVRSAVLSLAKIINDDLPRKIKKPKAIRAWYREHNKAIAEGTRDVLKSLKTAAGERLAALKAQRAEYAAAVTQSAKDYAGLGNLVLGENENLSASGIAQYFRDRLSAITNFNAKLASLKGRITSSLYDQIAKMGVEQGTSYAEALSTASPQALAEINSLGGQIDSAAAALGTSTAQTMYGAGVQSAQGYYDGLQSMLAKIEKQGVKIAKALVKQLRKALGIKSPSRVMRGVGKYTVDGLDQGLDERRVADKGRDLAKSLVKGYANPQLDAQFSAGVRNSADLKPAKSGGVIIHKIEVRLDASMSKEEMGKAYNDAIEAAKKIGLVDA